MTGADLGQRYAQFHQSESRVQLSVLAVTVLATGAATYLVVTSDLSALPEGGWLAFLALFLVPLAGVLVRDRLLTRAVRRLGLSCPHCNRRLVGGCRPA